MASFVQRLFRKKVLQESEIETSDLNRCLTVLDLIFLGIGSTMGAGLYVVIGQVALETAGPAVTISFLVAALASAMAGLCYAEFAARIPRAGSAYVYSYVTVGELMAFVIGWNLILEYVIGTASVARAWSSYFDNLIGNRMSAFFQEHMPIHIAQLSDYPDFFALGITLVLTGLLIFGVKESARFNNIFTCINLLVVLYITICGLFKLDTHNWNLSESEVPKGRGSGGFAPYGFSGVLAGAATCFYAFVGFDCVATTGEETKNPQKATPIAVVVSLFVVFSCYFGVSAIVTLMCPYFLLNPDAALPQVFGRAGWGVARYLISVGAMCGLSTSLLGAMFPLPRILYAMANDGVIFRFLGKVDPWTKTPGLGTAISGLFAGVMAMMFNLSELVDMMSIGTLLAYTLVSVSVLILRYEADVNIQGGMSQITATDAPNQISTCAQQQRQQQQYKEVEQQQAESQQGSTFRLGMLFRPDVREPTPVTALVTKVTMGVLCAVIVAFCLVSIVAADALLHAKVWAVCLEAVLGLGILVCSVIIYRQPQNPAKLHFKVPFLPWLPIVSVLVNIYLMLKLSYLTWIRFGVWMAIGFLIYFTYGIRQSETGRDARLRPQNRNVSVQDEEYHSPVHSTRETDMLLPKNSRDSNKREANYVKWFN